MTTTVKDSSGAGLTVGARVRIPGSTRADHFGRITSITDPDVDEGRMVGPYVFVLFDDDIEDRFVAWRPWGGDYVCDDIELVAETLAEKVDSSQP